MRRTNGALMMKWFSWLLLAATAVLFVLYFREQHSRLEGRVGVWIGFAVLGFGSIIVWVAVAECIKSIVGSALVLGIALVYCCLAIPLWVLVCTSYGVNPTRSTVVWVRLGLLATHVLIWVVGVSVLVHAASHRLRQV